MKEFIGTFGSGQEYAGYYVQIFAENIKDARNIMFENFGRKWAFVYTIESWESWVEYAKERGFPVEKRMMTLKRTGS